MTPQAVAALDTISARSLQTSAVGQQPPLLVSNVIHMGRQLDATGAIRGWREGRAARVRAVRNPAGQKIWRCPRPSTPLEKPQDVPLRGASRAGGHKMLRGPALVSDSTYNLLAALAGLAIAAGAVWFYLWLGTL